MFLKSEIQNKKFINFSFLLFLVLSFVSLIWTVIYHQNDFEIPFIGHINADLRINAEFDRKLVDKIHFYTGNVELKPYVSVTKNTYVSFETERVNLYNLSIKIDDTMPKDTIRQIKDIVVFVSDRVFYYTNEDILNFEKTKDNRYLFPKDLKYSKNSKYITDKGSLTHFSLSFLSIFYNMQYYIFPILFFVIALSIYILNKDKIELGFNLFKAHAIWIILILAFIIRFQGSDFDLWSDELYVATVAGNPNLPFSMTFYDPGNPPLFFILARYWQMLFSSTESVLRLLSNIFSILSIYFTYRFVKDNLTYKHANSIALLVSFILTINIYSIQNGQEFRTYAMSSFLAILSSYILFRIIKYKKTKDYIFYTLTICLMANAHYFQILIIASNFFFGIFNIEGKKDKIKFLTSNIFAFLSFLPYFFLTALNRAVLDTSFNQTIGLFPNSVIYKIFSQLFYSKITGTITLVVLIALIIDKYKYKLFNIEKTNIRLIYCYSLYVIIFVMVSAQAISYIRPIIKSFYLTNAVCYSAVVISLIFVLLSLIIKNFKFLKIILCTMFFILYFNGHNFFEKKGLLTINFDGTFKYAYFDSPAYKDKGLKIGIAIHDTPNYAMHYKEYLKGDEEIIMYEFGHSIWEFVGHILNSSADVIYTRLEQRLYSATVYFMNPYADISFIRGKNDIIYARIVKKIK